jgi:exosortase C (VPDSG-CTERM-specific)
VRRFLTAGTILLLCFSLPLFQVLAFALKSELFSYIILVPVISGYLCWIGRAEFSSAAPPLPPGWAVAFWMGGLAVLMLAVQLLFSRDRPAPVDYLALAMYAFVLLLVGFACYFLGRQTLRAFAFPLGFLVFLAPFPLVMQTGIETVLQHGSSIVAQTFFELAGMPVYRSGTFFQLPNFSMEVAPECSGIRSTLALFLTSLVAGQLFLRSRWKRVVLALIVFPLALVRNGFRVFVIGELCVRIGPEMINSWIHRHGGPVFFALSLVPFFLILYGMYKSELPALNAPPSPQP